MPGRNLFLSLGLIVAGVASALAQCDCAPIYAHSCTLRAEALAIFAGTVTEIPTGTMKYRFHVDEKFEGVNSDYFEVEWMPCGWEFEVGKQYLVFVIPMHLDDGDHLFAQQCGMTRELKDAAAVLEQLRVEKQGKRDASVYGMLRRTLPLDLGAYDENYVRPLPGVVVRLQSRGRSYETKTDEHGAYAFRYLPPGTYQASADLPSGLGVAQQILREPVPPFKLLRDSCYENDINALPTGKITGQVIGPDGVPLDSCIVGLYRLDRYDAGVGIGGDQEGSKRFEFSHLQAGDYVLVFNRTGQAHPDYPFPRTFYPGTPDFPSAQIIHLQEGQNIANADIHLRQAATPTRKIAIQLLWGLLQSKDYYPPQVFVTASEGAEPYPNEISDDKYTLNMLLNATYTIYAEADCRVGTNGRAKTDTVTLNGGDTSVSELKLTFSNKGGCVKP
jgi:hypothetical protein